MPIALAVSSDTGKRPAEEAYQALSERRLDTAVERFQAATAADPSNLAWRKDYAYALLRIGERERARDEFAEVVRQDPADEQIALEYAFLSYETRQPQAARRVFLRLQSSQRERVRTLAREAMERIDSGLNQALSQWKSAVLAAPRQWSAHEELARLAELRDEFDLAAAHFEEAWKLRPDRKELLLDLARVWRARGDTAQAKQALVAAYRSGVPRVAESARELLEGIEPGASDAALAAPETRQGIGVAEETALFSAKQMGKRSLELSYLSDAVKYLTLAHRQDPADGRVMYDLGVAANLLRRDDEALRWFSMARKSGDPDARREASIAYQNLRKAAGGFGLTTWALPFYSSRWNDMFYYGQVRGEWRTMRGRLTPYLSLRVIGDSQGGTGQNPWMGAGPCYLSESSLIAAAGLQARPWRRWVVWGEAGEAFSYLGRRRDFGLARPDYRAGVSWLKGWGRLMGSPETGRFVETGIDATYLSRFHNDVIGYSQTRYGVTWKSTRSIEAQTYLAGNFTVDTRREYWANFFEAGLGMRVRFAFMPPATQFRIELLRGTYTSHNVSPAPPGYWDLRIGVWYAQVH